MSGEAELRAGFRVLPLRQDSAHGQPPADKFMRGCWKCRASFAALDTGPAATERGIWDDTTGLRWYCSVECAPASRGLTP